MLPEELHRTLREKIDHAVHPREVAVDVMFLLQNHYGFLSDEALRQGADLLGLTPVELDELATFYDFVYREPVGRYVIHVCDGVVCWMFEGDSILGYLCRALGVEPGATTADGLFTVLPASCIGYCDRAPAMLINGQLYGSLNPESIDRILEELRDNPRDLVICR